MNYNTILFQTIIIYIPVKLRLHCITKMMKQQENLNSLPLPGLFTALNPPQELRKLLAIVKNEDIGHLGDITTIAMLGGDEGGSDRNVCVSVVARESGILCGLPIMEPLCEAYNYQCKTESLAMDGTLVKPGQTVATLQGKLSEILILERPLLNFVTRLSGIATLASKYVDCVSGSDNEVKIYDTRKTTPGLRMLEKYAVRCGGGYCHRIGLYDAILVKDNHLFGVGTGQLQAFLTAHLTDIRQKYALQFIEVEVDTLEQLSELLTCPAGLIDYVLLDNMSISDLQKAVEMVKISNSRIKLEASGGITLDTIKNIVNTGVKRISIGAITHSATGLDFGLDIL